MAMGAVSGDECATALVSARYSSRAACERVREGIDSFIRGSLGQPAGNRREAPPISMPPPPRRNGPAAVATLGRAARSVRPLSTLTYIGV